MSFIRYSASARIAILAVTALTASGGVIADITSICGTGCVSLTYSGAPGMNPTGNAIKIVTPSAWGHLSNFGLSGDWISYAETGNGTNGQLRGNVNFVLKYALNPAWDFNEVVFNVMADDFAQITPSPDNFGPLPTWGPQIARHCSSNPPGCLDSQLYTYRLTDNKLAMFKVDNQLTFTVTQLLDNTPFGLAFDIQLIDPPTSAPESGTLGLVGVMLIAGWAGFRYRRTR